ncbi:MAG: UDP-N-acetylmuramoyl-L-alanine--D-glutamate ligase [Candidatus Omnitrophica bacterium]|nr:UDP-N-acetylmuramoyl-L-alanine--D-glutamate ligase [Candidatus Omnitrophota bacterium]
MSCDQFGVDWKGRRVLVVGLGKSGMSASTFLSGLGCRVRVTEMRDEDATQRDARQLREQGIDAVELGAHRPQRWGEQDVVVVSPGVPESSVPIRWSLDHGVPILSEIELAFRFCPSPIIAVTGTNGKSSVVTLIQQILMAARRPAVACGNLGIPFTQVLPGVTRETTVVLEVSSFQLMWCDQFHPAIGVLLNLGSNHLDRHHDRAGYLAAKARLFARQTPQDAAVLNARSPEVVAMARLLQSRCVWFGDSSWPLFPEAWEAALAVARLLDIPDPLTNQMMREFRGLEHRLEHLGMVQGVYVINDSKSTTPDSLLYALTRCRGGVVPILGGRNKGMDFSVLKGALHEARIHGVVLIGESRQHLRALFNGTPPICECGSLDEAVQAAMALAHPGDTVLFSPACASFDMFRNFEERGRIFKQLVVEKKGTQTN